MAIQFPVRFDATPSVVDRRTLIKHNDSLGLLTALVSPLLTLYRQPYYAIAYRLGTGGKLRLSFPLPRNKDGDVDARIAAEKDRELWENGYETMLVEVLHLPSSALHAGKVMISPDGNDRSFSGIFYIESDASLVRR